MVARIVATLFSIIILLATLSTPASAQVTVRATWS